MKKFLKIDFLILLCSITLLGIGLFTLYSITTVNLESKQELFRKEFISQLIFTFTGLIISIIVFIIPPVYFRFKLILGILYTITLSILLFTAYFGLNVRGVRRWLSIGGEVSRNGTISGGITIQPSEFAKIAVIVITAAILSYSLNKSPSFKTGFKKVLGFISNNRFILIAILLNLGVLTAIVAQRSLSVASIMGLIMASVIFAGIKNKLLAFLMVIAFFISLIMSQSLFFNLSIAAKVGLLAIALMIYGFAVFIEKLPEMYVFCAIVAGIFTGAVLLPLSWNYVLHDYQKARIEIFLDPSSDKNKQGDRFQQEQSKISIGAGQIFGQGVKQISDSRLLNLPEPTTDFIFGIFAFKFGFVGSFIVIMLYLVLISRLFYLSDQMTDRFSSLVLVGVATMILIQFFVNLGMNLDILPVGGTTLPFMSAGGSSLISMMMSIALCESIIATNNLEKNVYHRKDKVFINGWNM